MIVLITGGSGSGKSKYAENLAAKSCKTNLIYIATMKPYDDECLKKIDRHRNMRKNKGFETIERYTNMKELTIEGKPIEGKPIEGKLKEGNKTEGIPLEGMPTEGKLTVVKPTVLLECMSNLLANEMYSDTGMSQIDKSIPINDEIMAGINHLAAMCENVFIVSNEVFSDDGIYDDETKSYIEHLGTINSKIAALASHVIEVVCGIPIYIKGGWTNDLD